MVPTGPPRLEDRNVRWCHCACREPHLSPVPCCSAWPSCSRGRTRWPEWKWQERLCERGDKHLWWLVLNKYPPYLCSDDYHFDEFKLSASPLRDSYLPPHPSRQNARAESQTWGKRHLLSCTKALLPGWTFPQLLWVSARPPVLMKPCAAQQQDFTLVAHCAHTAFRLDVFPPSISRPSTLPLVELLYLPLMLSLSLQNICQKIIGRTSWQEGSSYAQPLPLAGLISTMIMLCISTRRLLVFIRKVLEYISWVGKINETNFFYGDPLVTYF